MSSVASIKKTVTIINRRGLHARASSKFVKLAAQYGCEISVARNGFMVPGKSLMGLLTLGAGQGKDIDIVCTGSDAQDAMDALADLVTRGFDEDDSDGN